jgi:spermidine synthase
LAVPSSAPGRVSGTPGALRLSLALFFMAFGYSLLSVCLFRLLAFTLSSTAFFVLYVAAAMPLGAYVAQRRSTSTDGPGSLAPAVAILFAVTALLPFIGWIATRGQAMTSTVNPFIEPSISLRVFWQRLVLQSLAVAPVFVAWGYAEFVAYRLAIHSGSRLLQGSFYLLVVWALACALAVGFVLIPWWGVLRTVALASIAALAALDCARPRTAPSIRRAVPYVALAAATVAAGAFEPVFIRRMFVDVRYNLGDLLDNRRLPWSDERGETSLLAAVWGKYSHFALAKYERNGRTEVLGAYDGVVYWEITPDRKDPYNPLNAVVFDHLPAAADVAVLGAGGGRQVSDALHHQARSVVAVDLVPEVFTLLKGPYAWANGYVYQAPNVRTVAADGRSFLEGESRQFDAILLPHTESALANMKALFEMGSRLHSVEAFRVMRERLKPAGIVATMKAVDTEERLFNRYAASFREAGLHVVGWTQPSRGLQTFLLLASPTRAALERDARTQEFLARSGFRYVDFDATPPRGEALYDDSPWVQGVVGTMMPIAQLRWILFGIAAVAIAAVVAVTAVSLYQREPHEGAGERLWFVLAGILVGAHAASVQNAVIFWLLVNLFNPLAAFFVGTALFLLAWGVSSTMIARWPMFLAVGTAAILGLFVSGVWHGPLTLALLACVAIGSGLCFPLLGLSFQSRLLNLFVADAIGGFAAGVLGILVPLLLGFERYFAMVPWVSLVTIVLVALAVGGKRRAVSVVAGATAAP